MQYLINNWFGYSNNDTSTVFRTADKLAWLSKIRDIVLTDGINPAETRVVMTGNLTIWSYPTGLHGRDALVDNKPLAVDAVVRKGIPKEVRL